MRPQPGESRSRPEPNGAGSGEKPAPQPKTRAYAKRNIRDKGVNLRFRAILPIGDSKPRHVPQLHFRRRVHRVVAADGLRARSHDRGDPGRRPVGRRVLRRPSPAQPISRDLRRGRVQLGLCADLFAGADRRRRGAREGFFEPNFHAAADLATGAARLGVPLYDAIRRDHRSGLRKGPAEIRFRRRHDAHHLSLSRVHNARHPALGNPERAWVFQRGGLRFGGAQSVHHGVSRSRVPVSERRRRRELGRRRLGAGPTRPADGRGAPTRHSRTLGLPAVRPGCPAVLHRPGTGGDRLGGPADRHSRRHHPRLAAAHRRRVLDLLRRAPLPIAPRSHRRGGWNRAVAADEPPARGRRRRGGGRLAEPIDRAHPRPLRALPRRPS